MLRQSLATKSAQVRESYIAISKYVRGYHPQEPHPSSCCIRSYPHRTRVYNASRFLSSFGNRLEAPPNVTEGFPNPPGSQARSDNPSAITNSTTAAFERLSEKSYPSDPGHDTPVETAASQPISNAPDGDVEQCTPIRLIKHKTRLRRGFWRSDSEEKSDTQDAGAEITNPREKRAILFDTRRLTL